VLSSKRCKCESTDVECFDRKKRPNCLESGATYAENETNQEINLTLRRNHGHEMANICVRLFWGRRGVLSTILTARRRGIGDLGKMNQMFGTRPLAGALRGLHSDFGPDRKPVGIALNKKTASETVWKWNSRRG